MRSRSASDPDSLLEHMLHWGVLAVLLVFTYVRLFEVPYKGFAVNPRGEVLSVFVDGSPGNPLRVGDRLIRAGDLSWVDFRADFDAVLFDGLEPGQSVPIIVERDEVRRSIQWTYPGLNRLEFIRHLWSTVWLSLFFWVVGIMTAIHLRPKGEARTVAVAFSYLAALWLILGGDTVFSHVWHAAYYYTFIYWIGVPLSLHFHWIWPRPLAKLHPTTVWLAYGGSVLVALGIVFGLVPRAAFSVAAVFVLVGILVLLALHAILQPELRRNLGRFLILGALSVLPLGTYSILSQHLDRSVAEMLGAIGIPLIPLAYLLAVRRRDLAPLQLRANRAVTFYVFLVLLALVVLPLVALAALGFPDPGPFVAVGLLSAVVGATMGWLGYPRLQALMERRFLKLPVASNTLVATYSSRIVSCGSIPRLEALLRDEVLPSLLIRQFAFLRIEGDRTRVLFAVGVGASELPDGTALPELWKGEGRYREASPEGEASPFPWIRLVMALGVEEDLVGVWLFGRRDPDDVYMGSEIALLRSLANQTAIALSNIIQTERLRELYQANVTRTEEERLQLAHALHDRVLNQLAALLMRLDDPSITPAVLKSFEEFSNRIREIVADLRPPMLVYGLRPALAELVESLSEQPPQEVSFSLDVPDSQTRYSPEVELHLFRIAQESCQNALHHAHARKITISGRLDADQAEIQIVDDGTGFRMTGAEGLANLIAQKHFGLAGLTERASLIGGTVQIRTAPGKGTRIKAVWKAKPTGALPHISS